MLCGDREILVDSALKVDGKREFVTWGPRWQSIRRVHAGDNRALVELALPDEFAADLDEMVLHPALVDVATAVGSAMIGGQSNYLPLSYGRVEVHDRLPGHLFSLIELKSEGAGRETLSFDVLLLDEEGRVRVAVHGFTMKRVGEAASRFQASPPSGRRPEPPEPANQRGQDRRAGPLRGRRHDAGRGGRGAAARALGAAARPDRGLPARPPRPCSSRAGRPTARACWTRSTGESCRGRRTRGRTSRRPTRRRATTSRRGSPPSGRACSASSRSACTTTSSTSGATPCWASR